MGYDLLNADLFAYTFIKTIKHHENINQQILFFPFSFRNFLIKVRQKQFLLIAYLGERKKNSSQF